MAVDRRKHFFSARTRFPTLVRPVRSKETNRARARGNNTAATVDCVYPSRTGDFPPTFAKPANSPSPRAFAANGPEWRHVTSRPRQSLTRGKPVTARAALVRRSTFPRGTCRRAARPRERQMRGGDRSATRTGGVSAHDSGHGDTTAPGYLRRDRHRRRRTDGRRRRRLITYGAPRYQFGTHVRVVACTRALRTRVP